MLNFYLNYIWFIKHELNYVINHPNSLKLNNDLIQGSEEADFMVIFFVFIWQIHLFFYMLTSSHLLNNAPCSCSLDFICSIMLTAPAQQILSAQYCSLLLLTFLICSIVLNTAREQIKCSLNAHAQTPCT